MHNTLLKSGTPTERGYLQVSLWPYVCLQKTLCISIVRKSLLIIVGGRERTNDDQKQSL
jgi:hypothetical protein